MVACAINEPIVVAYVSVTEVTRDPRVPSGSISFRVGTALQLGGSRTREREV